MNNDELTREFLRYFTQHHRQLYAYIRPQVRCRADANDILQEAAALLWEKFAEFDRTRDFCRWGCGFARRLVLKYYRENGRQQPLFSETVDELFATELLHSISSTDDRSDALSHCIAKLEDRQRTILNLRYQSECEVREIATKLNRSESAIYKTLTRVHEILQQCIQHKLVEWGAA